MGTGTTSDADCACQGDEKKLSLFSDSKGRVKGELPACRLYDNVTTVHRAKNLYEKNINSSKTDGIHKAQSFLNVRAQKQSVRGGTSSMGSPYIFKFKK